MASKPRFERAKDVLGAGIGSREGAPAKYLAKLWTLFGSPEARSDGSAYYSVRDRESGQEFTVSTNVLGISYGAALESRSPRDFVKKGKALAPMFAAFDRLLAATPLADCSYEIQLGEGTLVLGAKGGVPFEENRQPPPPTRTQAIARAEAALSKDGNANFFEWELLTLRDTACGALDQLRRLWERWFAAVIGTLDGELADPRGADRGTVRLALEAEPRLVEYGRAIAIDVDVAFALYAATFDAARRAIEE